MVGLKLTAKKILVSAYAIQPGGGPPGYSYNFFQGLGEISKDDHGGMEFIPSVPISDERYNGTEFNAPSKRERIKGSAKSILILVMLPIIALMKRRRKRGTDCDLAILHGYRSAEALLKRILKSKYIYMPHCPTVAAEEVLGYYKMRGVNLTSVEYYILLATESALFRYSAGIVFPSLGAMESYLPHFRNVLVADKLNFVRSSVPIPQRTNERPMNKGYVLFAGRYVEHKGFDLYCRAAEIAKSQGKEMLFCSIGGGPLSVGNAVTDLGWQSSPQSFLEAAKVVVIPNREAYYDLLPIECAALGIPLVMTNVGGSADQLAIFPDSVSCPPNDADALAASIIQAWDMASDKNWGGRNRTAYCEYFSLKVFAQSWIQVVDRILHE